MVKFSPPPSLRAFVNRVRGVPDTMKKECLLISSPAELNIFPRGIMEIATFLNQQGCPTSVLPLGYYFQKDYAADSSGYIIGDIDRNELYAILQDVIREIAPQVIGVSNSFTKDFPYCIEIIKICKEINPKIVTVMGGQHVTFCDQEALQTPELDVVVRGEGEWIMLNLLRAVTGKKELSGVRGITIRQNGGIGRTPPEPLGKLEEISAVDFALLPSDFVRKACIIGISYRGCAHHCKYCVEEKFWARPRAYTLEKLITEMKVLQRDYQTQIIGLGESMLDMRSKIFYDLCRGIRDNEITLPPDFFMTTRIDTVTDQGVDCLAKTGIKSVSVGIENFSPKVLKMMAKNQSMDVILEGCEKFMKKDIWLLSYWLIGHPGDNADEADYNYSKFKEFFEKGLLKRGTAFIFVPYPGTDYFNHPEQYGIRISSYDWKQWNRWTKDPVSWLDDFPKPEIVAAYDRAHELLRGYNGLNNFLYYMSAFDRSAYLSMTRSS
ncbi:MAG: hypothetical protein CO150_08475 [Nitrospirae bacterium CG_4_9_14_3_um_filter_53_35]|nr:MAG: hypothetical protein COT35_09885 [Nitrospirae bacterium CG08_land_8_20_14_0_20_52_24]PIW85947.1 MAG: hypothetical protein COZ95_01930 [Nitrospirae bacterium CG_4_8_14_3_um_filter_50_41]PIX85497.1 MAG: hypothetical protein COZ32_08135 [Nitrospirae bacterium CG_4_10_14_3_um_filter_53_41]PJA73111.1 MAG: hypothetical protein CO150_08475 [Nitrospirae bacterium CG_4_9_14_3_um_filter_53_35]